jgi:glycosyltransferase involved in cell wall biosynthesis
MKILYVVEHYHPYIGGVEKLFKTLCEEVAAQGDEVTVVTTLHKESLPQKETLNGVLIRRIPVKNRYLFTFFGWIWILKYAKGKDLIHTTSYNAALPAFFTGLFMRKKVIVTFHEVWQKQWFEVPFLSSVERWSFFLYEKFILHLPFTKFIGVSEFTFQKLIESKASKKVIKIFNGIDYSALELPIVKEKLSGFNYLFFGRLGVSKGIDLMIEAAKIFNAKHKDATFHFVLPKYPKPMRKKVMEYFKSHQPKQVKLYHELPYKELLQLKAKVNCAVIPSISEGFGFSAAECCAVGMPIISSERGALSEVTYGKVNRFNPYTAENLALALENAYQNKWDTKPEIKFHLSEMVDQYKSLYNSI